MAGAEGVSSHAQKGLAMAGFNTGAVAGPGNSIAVLLFSIFLALLP